MVFEAQIVSFISSIISHRKQKVLSKKSTYNRVFKVTLASRWIICSGKSRVKTGEYLEGCCSLGEGGWPLGLG